MFEQSCELTLAVFDGKYGAWTEVSVLIGLVLFFNFFMKWILSKLHQRFERTREEWKDSFAQSLYLPLSSFVWFFAIVNGINLMAARLMPGARCREMHLTFAVGGILALAWFFLRWKDRIVELTLRKSKKHEIALNPGKISVIDKFATVVILFIAGMLLLEVTNSSMNTLIAFGGVGGLSLAFASQEIVANFFGGLMIYMTHPFTIGDWINLPERNIEGIVEEVGWYMTRVQTFDKRPIYIPNSIFTRIIVMNPSRMSHREFKETIGLRYRDMNALKPIIEEIRTLLHNNLHIDQDQMVSVHFKAFGSSSLDILIKAYTKKVGSEEFAIIKEQILLAIGDIVAKHGAEMAFPTTSMDIPDGLKVVKIEQ